MFPEESDESVVGRRVWSLPGPASSPFLFTSYVRPLTVRLEDHLSQHGAKLFATLWSRHSTPPASPPARRRGVCLLPAEWGGGGGCGGRIPQWTYNSRTGQCETYWYSGCGATNNLFSNERKCRLQCSGRQSGGTEGEERLKFRLINSLNNS